MPDKPKVLHLTIKKKYFDQIAWGEKKLEYREIKPHWESRIDGKEFDEVHFRNGYSQNAPFMRVELLCVMKFNRNGWYIIELGKVLEIRR